MNKKKRIVVNDEVKQITDSGLRKKYKATYQDILKIEKIIISKEKRDKLI